MKACLVLSIAITAAAALGCSSSDETVNPVTTSASSSGAGGSAGGTGAGGFIEPLPPWVIDPVIQVSGEDNQVNRDCRTGICRHNENTDMTLWKGSIWLVHRTAFTQILGPNSALHTLRVERPGQDLRPAR